MQWGWMRGRSRDRMNSMADGCRFGSSSEEEDDLVLEEVDGSGGQNKGGLSSVICQCEWWAGCCLLSNY